MQLRTALKRLLGGVSGRPVPPGRLALLAMAWLAGASSSNGQSFIELGRTTFGGNDYLLVGLQPSAGAPVGSMDPFQAQAAADFFGGWLMTVASRQEEVTVVEALRDFRTTVTGDGDFWIGITDREDFGATEGNFVWQNGEPVTYTNWAPGEPNDVGSGEDWGEIWVVGADDVNDPEYITWNDESDGHDQNFAIVEMVGIPPPLVIEVNAVTGHAFFATTFTSQDIISVTLTDYQARPDGTPFNVAAWESSNLSARGVDAIDPGSEGSRWEVVDRSPGQLIEAYLLGGSQLEPGERLMLGELFSDGVGQDVDADVDYAVNIDFADPTRPDGQAVVYGDLVTVPVIVVDPDYNNDGAVDAADYTVWRDSVGSTGTGLAADGNADGVVDQNDYGIWKANYGLSAPGGSSVAVPSPAASALAALVVSGVACACCRRG